MRKTIDLIGQRFGKLVVDRQAEKNKHGAIRWFCKCDCGNETILTTSHLKSGNTKNCGCLQKEIVQQNFIDLTGKKFGKLTVRGRATNDKRGTARWLCECECGTNKEIRGDALRLGITNSCGCLAIEKTIQRNKNNKYFKKNHWTKKEIEILKKFYSSKGPEYCISLINRTRAAIITKARDLNLQLKIIKWSDKDIEFLKKFYPNKGVTYCSKALNKNCSAIKWKAISLNIKSTIVNGGLPQKFVIKQISKNKVVAKCKIHGESIHYYSNKIGHCKKCSALKTKPVLNDEQRKDRNRKAREYNKNPIRNFTGRLRALMRIYLKRIKNGDVVETKGCFRNLDYTPVQLYNYLENIKRLQNNCCPICNKNYTKCELNIEHVIPVSRAKTEQEVVDLFCLQNLNLMCKSCNLSKSTEDYTVWKNNKNVIE